MGNMAALTSATTLTTISSSAYNTNLTTIRDWANTYAVMKDVAATVSVGHTFTATQTFTPGSGAAITVTSGGLTITAGGLTISAGGAAITGNSTVTGTLNVTSTLTQNSVAVVTGSGTNGRSARWTAGGVIANGAASDDGTFITNATQPCLRAAGTITSITNSSSGDFTWTTSPPLNVGPLWAVGNPTRITIPAGGGGTYLFTGVIRMPGNSVTAADAYTVTLVPSPGSTTGNGYNVTLGASSADEYQLPISAVFQAAAADYYVLRVANNSGNTISSLSAILSVVKLW